MPLLHNQKRLARNHRISHAAPVLCAQRSPNTATCSQRLILHPEPQAHPFPLLQQPQPRPPWQVMRIDRVAYRFKAEKTLPLRAYRNITTC